MGIITNRLEHIRRIMMDAHGATSGVPNASIGTDREAFVANFLSVCLPSIARFGSGMIIDQGKGTTGQLDIVIENPFFPSIPSIGRETSRIYLAESVGAVIEVKSDLHNQATEALNTAAKVAALKRDPLPSSGNTFPSHHIQTIAVAYKGHTTRDGAERLLQRSPLGAILILEDPGIFVSKPYAGSERHPNLIFWNRPEQSYGEGGRALWLCLCYLCHVSGFLNEVNFDPTQYQDP